VRIVIPGAAFCGVALKLPAHDGSVPGFKQAQILSTVPTENSILEKISKAGEARRANHSGFRPMIASLGEVSSSPAWRIVPVFIVSTYIKENGSQATRRS